MGVFKQCRGTRTHLPISLESDADAEHVFLAAIRKLTQFNYVTHKDFLLVYPDGTEVKTIPGSSERFTISRYKEEIGKPYCRIKLFLCPKDDYKGMWMEGTWGH